MTKFQCIVLAEVAIIVMLSILLYRGGHEEKPQLAESEIADIVGGRSDSTPLENPEEEIDATETAIVEGLSGVRLWITIKDEANQPKRWARVSLRGPVELSKKSDSLGMLKFESLPRGQYKVRIEHKGFPTLKKRITLREDMTQKNYTLKSYTLMGKVFDSDSRLPLEKFNIRWLGGVADGNSDMYFKTHGEYTVNCTRGLLDGIMVSASGYTSQRLSMDDFSLNGSEFRREIMLTPSEDGIEGIVVDTQDNPIAGVPIFYGQRFEELNNPEYVESTTGQDGTFRLAPIKERKRYIAASHPDYAPAYVVYEKEHQYKNLRLTLNPASRIYGTVTQGGNPLVDQSVKAQYFGETPYGQWSTKTDAQGHYEFQGLSSGKCSIICEIPLPHEADSPTREIKLDVTLELAKGESRQHDFEIPGDTGELEVKLLNLGKEDEIEKVMLHSVGDINRMWIEGDVDEDAGMVVFKEIPAGSWMFLAAVVVEDTISLPRKKIDIYPGETSFVEVNVQQGTGRISGVVTGTPKDSTRIVLLYEEAFEVMSPKITEDIHALFAESIVSEELISFWMDFTLFGRRDQESGPVLYTLLNIPEGRYTLVATGTNEESDLDDFSDWNIFMLEVTISDDEHLEIDFEF